MQTVIIDTDIGGDIDDACAIAFALKRPELDVKAVTTVAEGSVWRARIVHKLLRIVERDDVKVAAGMELPLAPVPAEARREYLQNPDPRTRILTYGAWVGPGDPEHDMQIDHDAVRLIIDTVEERPGAVTVVAIGRLTNVAAALQMRPDIAPKIKHIAVMGGELAVHRLECNIRTDAVAAGIVFESGVPMFLGTWSVTRRFVIGPELCGRIRRKGTPVCRALIEMIDLWWPHRGSKPGPVMYDLAPILWSYDPGRFRTEPKRVVVETRGEHSAGLTRAVGGAPNMQVTVDMDAASIADLYMDTILS